MAGETKTVSARLPVELLREASGLWPDATVTDLLADALQAWVVQMRRRQEDAMIVAALSSLSPDRTTEESVLADQGSQAGRRAMEREHG